jgi:eukaryotic-like serine/threonine-protein kinase
MDAERYQKIDQLVDAALELEAGKRAAFLDQACLGDSDLRREVDSLIQACLKAENFIEKPAMEFAARSLAQDSGLSFTGKIIRRYEISTLIGVGGMGEVYLAHDQQMHRKVALKLLPAEFTKSPDRVVRFQRESRAASSLNHPNILTIYEIGEERGIHFIASEYIEGDTLRRKMNRGAPGLKEVLEIAEQMASALMAAHTAGIVHRDIKPENIMIRHDGYVKVLDFGLAKLTEASDSSQSGAEQITQSGAVLGTINYMSPEQARGEEIDSRTDIFSLGVVLYEMVTGVNPFKGNSIAETFDAILNRAPAAIANYRADLPVELNRIINRSLEKDRDLRYQTAADFRVELKRLERDIDSSPTVVAVAPPFAGPWYAVRKLMNFKTALITVVLLAVATISWLLMAQPNPDPARKSEAPVIRNAFAVTEAAGEELFPSLAPDAKVVIYVKKGASDKLDIYQQRVGGKNADNLTADSPEDDTQPAYSPNGERIAFRSERDGGGIFIMGASGESARRLTSFGYNPAWSPDGKQIVCATQSAVDAILRGNPQSQLWAIEVATQNKRLITEGDAVQPSWSPHAHRIAYWNKHKGGQRDVWTISTTQADPVQVTDDAAEDWNPIWSPDGNYLYFVSTRGGYMNVWRVRIDEQSGKVLSEPEPVTLPASSAQHICLSRDGTRIVYTQAFTRRNIQKLEFDPINEKVAGQPVWVTQGTRSVTSPRLSPDGEWFVHDSIGDQQYDIFVMKKDGTGERNLTQDEYKDISPQWSPDGERIAFHSDRSGTYQIWTIKPDGSELKQITFSATSVIYPVWSPDGLHMAYSGSDYTHSHIIDLSKPWHEQMPQLLPPMVEPDTSFIAVMWSADGKKLVGPGIETSSKKNKGIYVYWIESQKFEKLTGFGTTAFWLRDSRRILITNQNKLFIADSHTKKWRELFSADPIQVNNFKISDDDRMIYYTSNIKDADIWFATLE